MLKKLVAIILSFILIMGLSACGDHVSNVENTSYQSSIYKDDEIEAAIDVAESYFKKNFSGCTLTEITYAGDEKSEDHIEWAERHNADEVIVLISSFDVDASGGDGSLNPNSTYENWMWILVRDGGGEWKHVDHGY